MEKIEKYKYFEMQENARRGLASHLGVLMKMYSAKTSKKNNQANIDKKKM